MDRKLRRPTKQSLASVAVAAAFAIALPAGAIGAADKPMGEMIVAQAATPAPMKPAKSTAPKGSHSEMVESRISEMHTKLKITQTPMLTA
jgi:hypothetical protein